VYHNVHNFDSMFVSDATHGDLKAKTA